MIIHTGEALIDFIPTRDPDGRSAYRPSPGGSPYNTAIASARLGAPASFLGRISRDFFGDQLMDTLVRNGVGVDYCSRTDDPSTLAFVQKSERGEARYAFFTNGAADRGLTRDHLPTLGAGVDAIQFGSISLIPDPVGSTVLSMVEAESERVVSFDPNIRDVLIEEEAEYRAKIERAVAASTIVKISDEDMAWINPSDDPGRGAAAVLDRGARLVLVTSGEGGAFARTSRAEARLPAVPVKVSDTIGAGDSFHAAVLAWLHHMQLLTRDAIERLSQSDLERMLRFCTTVAAATCSRPGSDPPKLSELDAEVVTWNR